MNPSFEHQISRELSIEYSQVVQAAALLDEGATIPFIARYRKEKTGGLNEVHLINIRDRLVQLRELAERKKAVLSSIKEQGKLTDELEKKIIAAPAMSVLEDLYLPYRPKRRTRATVAKEKGLEPLAELIFKQTGADYFAFAAKLVDPKKEITTAEDAIAGARDIIAEWINEDSRAREKLRALFRERATIHSKCIKGKETEGAKYKDYFTYTELAKNAPSHRVLAIRRAEKENILLVHILPEQDEAIAILNNLFVLGSGPDSREVAAAVLDSYKRLMSVSLETEFRLELKRRADEEAIGIFKENLKQLLMAPPLGQKRVLAIDPGQRTGCKTVCLDRQGNLLVNDTFYLFDSPEKKLHAQKLILELCEKYQAEIIAIGNGTASRETEVFLRSIKFPKSIPIAVVSESGASVYSASEVAREEFPDHDVTVRGAVSIGRRLMDPLSELVKIDPKSIGVGQYQHDVDQAFLKRSLDDVVVSCVNQVGVELNTASKELLMYVSGIGPKRAAAIVSRRAQQGPFKSREELLSVDGLTAKTFEQSAGFLRIMGAQNPLDSTGIHPEAYPVVGRMAEDAAVPIEKLIADPKFRSGLKLEKYVTDQIGIPTLKDILIELEKPGRDPRPAFELFSFKDGISGLEDLKPGMKLAGVVTNITAFGVFVDIGVHCDGLVHVSQMADRFVRNPQELVKLHQRVEVKVLEVDLERKRIALTMKKK